MDNKSQHFPHDEQGVCSLSTRTLISVLSEKIIEKLDSYYECLDVSNATLTGKRLSGQRLSRVIRFNISINRENRKFIIYAKLCPKWEKFNPAIKEYETLKILYERMPKIRKNFGVARPLDFFPDLNAYVMESVGTKNFKAYLLRANSRFKSENSFSELFAIVSKCAQWLAAFHNLTSAPKPIKFSASSLFTTNEDFDLQLFFRNVKFSKYTVSQLKKQIERLSRFDGLFDLPCAKWHWDFTPAHIYLDNNEIKVIDIAGIDNVPIYDDIGHFLAAMSTINNLPFYPFFDYHRADKELCNCFVEAYLSETKYDKQEFFLLSNIYKLKYLLFWFHAQYHRISDFSHPLIGDLFARLLLVNRFKKSIISTMKSI